MRACIAAQPLRHTGNWGLRDYGVAGQIGLEPTPKEYVAKMVEVFREVRRVLRKDATAWVNLGDSYCSIGHKKSHSGYGTTGLAGGIAQEHSPTRRENNGDGLKHKDLCGIPWRVAFALQADGWWLRSDIIWHKPNPMPESVTDRPTKSHEYIFLLSKSERYAYDAEVISEMLATEPHAPGNKDSGRLGHNGATDNCVHQSDRVWGLSGKRNRRTVWTVPTLPYSDAHFATFPPDLIKPCILAGCPVGGTVLDPFLGSGTTAMVALELGRRAIGIELNPKYVEMARARCNVTPGLALA